MNINVMSQVYYPNYLYYFEEIEKTKKLSHYLDKPISIYSQLKIKGIKDFS